MPLIVHEGLPSVSLLRSEGCDLLEHVPEGVKPYNVILLNLMPQKEAAEAEYYRMLSTSPFYVRIILAKMSHQTYKNTPQEYMDRFYTDIADLMDRQYDGMIVTGAPVEKLPFESVRYWEQLCEIFRWSRTHVRALLNICWGAQAALYALYGLPKYPLDTKLFGVYEQTILDRSVPIFDEFGSTFFMPNSRHTEVLEKDIEQEKRLKILSHSPLSGVSVVMANHGREIFVTGHLEYMSERLDFEFRRDMSRNLPIMIPYNYYQNDDPRQYIKDTWRRSGYLFYSNWIKYYVANKELDKFSFE